MARTRRKDGYARARDVEDAAQEWSVEVLKCRTLGHAWEQYDGRKRTRGTFDVMYRCERLCGVRKHEIWNSRGVVIKSVILYPRTLDGAQAYLMPPGSGRISREDKGILRIARITQTGFIETNDEVG